jgi:hypothetical protein
VIGAAFSLVLRVSIPNYRRKKTLKSQLDEARRLTAEISDQVDSQLRVLLRVERLLLDQRRREGYVIFPAYGETATLVEAGLTTLRKKIGFVQRLDACACRQEALAAGPVSPTRMNIIDANLTNACEVLKSDQLSDADWIFVQQRLEGADKALNEPTQEEKQAFEALLSRRWKGVVQHFGTHVSEEQTQLKPPAALKKLEMDSAFPTFDRLPRLSPEADKDEDGLKWIDSIGVVQADLQLTALDLLCDVQFRSTALQHKKWDEARGALSGYLSTPSLGNLARARQLLMQVEQGISEADILCALRLGQAEIDFDPKVVSPHQTVQMSVRFREPQLNGATARNAVQCEWLLFAPEDLDASAPEKTWRWWQPWTWLRQAPPVSSECREPELVAAAKAASQRTPEQTEIGWKVHRYFEPNEQQTIQAVFYHRGAKIHRSADPSKCDREGTLPVICTRVVRALVRRHHRIDKHERYWRFLPQALQLLAALIVPLAALALSTTTGAASGQWWELVGLGFGSETIRSILTGQPAQPASTAS